MQKFTPASKNESGIKINKGEKEACDGDCFEEGRLRVSILTGRNIILFDACIKTVCEISAAKFQLNQPATLHGDENSIENQSRRMIYFCELSEIHIETFFCPRRRHRYGNTFIRAHVFI